MKKIILASTSTIHNSDYLEYLLPTIKKHFTDCKTIIFIPFARPGGISYDDYTLLAKNAFAKASLDVIGIHKFQNYEEVLRKADGIFTGGGNTFELVNQLYKHKLIDVLKEVLSAGTPYLGTSAGTNICGVTMMNTNDMPIIYPPSFKTLSMISFNINAHYLDPDPKSTHMGETRETRIKEYHVFNETPVLGLREGSWLEVKGEQVMLKGSLTARWFQQNKEPVELPAGFVF